MSKYINDNELLSAYIDGELSVDEKNELEQRLNYSSDLKKKLDDLRKLKELTKSAVKELPESTYFETRFFAELNSSKPAAHKFRKFAPALGFSVLAIALMILLKLNPNIIDSLVEEQKTNIASFYKENLKPLLYAANLTNEDIFNFAFSNRLPLDEEENQVLQLGYDKEGKEFFEIRTISSLATVENNLEKFVKALNLNDLQRKQVDSILESYADGLQTQILVNDKNTLAINPNLWNYNKAITAELLSFASAANNYEFSKMIPAGYPLPHKRELKQYVSEVRTARDNEYIFFTPDSIFSEVYEFDKGKFRVEMEQMRKDLAKDLKEVEKEIKRVTVEVRMDSSFVRHKNKRIHTNFQVFVDSNSCRVFIPAVPVTNMKLPMLDSLDIYLDELEDNLRDFTFKIEMPEDSKTGVYNFQFGDSTKNFNFSIPENIRVPELDSLLKGHNYNLDTMTLPNMNFYYNTDSLSSMMQFFMNDSLNFFNHEEFRKDMKELEEEMEHFRKEMQELRKDIKKEKKKPVVTKPIEI